MLPGGQIPDTAAPLPATFVLRVVSELQKYFHNQLSATKHRSYSLFEQTERQILSGRPEGDQTALM